MKCYISDVICASEARDVNVGRKIYRTHFAYYFHFLSFFSLRDTVLGLGTADSYNFGLYQKIVQPDNNIWLTLLARFQINFINVFFVFSVRNSDCDFSIKIAYECFHIIKRKISVFHF